MRTLVVVDNPKQWPIEFPGVQVIDAKTYLHGGDFTGGRGTMVFNLCRSYRYQSMGYYVSLLAAARGHRALPSVSTIQDMKSLTILRYATEDLYELIQKSLQPLQSDRFTLSVYFGWNVAKRYDRLSRHLFNMFDAPFLRAEFLHDTKWRLKRISPIGANEIPPDHWDFVVERARAYFSRPRYNVRKKSRTRYDLAILYNPDEHFAPSDSRAIQKFERAGRRAGLETEVIDKQDYGRLAEFDALFIRETTQVNHHTFRFSRRAVAEGLVVIDDPQSILKCTNKVFLAELLNRHHIPAPRTVILHTDNLDRLADEVGFPCILKQPDSSFSQGVVKVENHAELMEQATRLLERSDLVIAQEFVPTSFDWRVGILNKQPLYVCRYYMARKHWQIQKTEHTGRISYGNVDSLAVEDAPPEVVKTALRAANPIGDGLYGVDLKQWNGRCVVIEVNDNPSIDSGIEDAVLKDELYDRIMRVFVERIEKQKARRQPR